MPATARLAIEDCPECMVKESVIDDICQVCFAELDEVAPTSPPFHTGSG
jgi:hypothetical protein